MGNIFLLYGILYDADGTTPVANATVKGRNESTGSKISITTDGSGQYILDFGNITGGWNDGDTLTAYTIYTDYESTVSVVATIAIPYSEQNLTLTAVADSSTVVYCTVQDVWDDLDSKTSSDISSDRIIKAIQQAEGLIDLRTLTFFKEVTVTDEVHTGDRYTLDVSPDYLDTLAPGINSRRDSMYGNINNRVATKHKPVVSITALSINQATSDAADSWNALIEQTGSGGDYYLEDSEAGVIDFLTSFPRLGKRSWKVTYVAGHDRDSTDQYVISLLRVIRRLATLIAVKNVITVKSSGSMFDSSNDVKIGTIEIKSGAGSTQSFISTMDTEIIDLWKEVGDFGIEVI